MLLVLMLLLAALPSGAQERLPPDPAALLVQSAGGLPPEFAADVLIRLVEAHKIADREERMDALQRAYAAADSARSDYRLSAVPVGFTDQTGAMASLATSVRIDRISLQCRAVRQMLAINGSVAAKLFTGIRMPTAFPFGCERDAVPDLRIYYETWLAVANHLRRAGLEGDDIERFTLDTIARVGSGVQAYPMADALQAFRTPDADSMERLLLAFSLALGGIEESDRLFSVELFHEASRSEFPRLLETATQPSVRLALLAAMARYYNRHLTGRRCEDTFRDENHRTARRGAVGALNAAALKAGLEALVEAEPAEGIRVEKRSASFDAIVGNREYRDFMTRLQTAGRMSGDSPEEERQREQEIRKLMVEVHAWERPDEMESRDFFLIKSGIFGGLVQLEASGPLGFEILQRYTTFLDLHEAQRQEFPAQWLWRLTQLLGGPRRMRDQTQALTAMEAASARGAGEIDEPCNVCVRALERVGSV